MDDRIIGIASAGNEPHDLVARPESHGATADTRDRASHFKPEDIRCAGWRRIQALTLRDIGTVYAGGGDPDQNFALTRRRDGSVLDPEHLGASARGG
jgi:hypothetical protein